MIRQTQFSILILTTALSACSANDNATSSIYGTGMEFKDGVRQTLEYEYDKNGNLTKDFNKKIASIRYNCLNLPDKLQLDGGNSLSNLYGADGTKLRATRSITVRLPLPITVEARSMKMVFCQRYSPKAAISQLKITKSITFIQDHTATTEL